MSALENARDSLRRRWLYRPGREVSGTSSGGPRRRISLGPIRWVLLLILLAFLLYIPVGMLVVHRIDDDPNFTPPADDVVEGGAASIDMAAALIDREVNINNWIANDPFFVPGYYIDDTPNFQKGIFAALGRFAFEMTDQIGRTRGSSQADPDLQQVAGLLQYAPDVWVWDPTVSIWPRATSEAQYRQARKRLVAYNTRLAAGDAVFDKRADNLMATLDRFAADLGSASAAINREVQESRGGLLDFNADDIFYDNKGRLYGYYMILTALEKDFANVIAEKRLETAWSQMMDSFRTAIDIQPWYVMNGDPDSLAVPNHLLAQGFYTLRARTQLREVTNILQK